MREVLLCMRKLSIEGLSNFYRVTQQTGIVTSTQSFLIYLDMFVRKVSENDILNSPSSSPRFPLLCCPLDMLPPGPSIQGKICSMSEKRRSSKFWHLQAPISKKEETSQSPPLWLLDPRLAGEPCAKRDLSGKQGLITKALRDARQNLPHKICKSLFPRCGWLSRQSRRKVEAGRLGSHPSWQSFGPQCPTCTRWHRVARFWLGKGKVIHDI